MDSKYYDGMSQTYMESLVRAKQRDLLDAYSQIETLTAKVRELKRQLEIANDNLKDIT